MRHRRCNVLSRVMSDTSKLSSRKFHDVYYRHNLFVVLHFRPCCYHLYYYFTYIGVPQIKWFCVCLYLQQDIVWCTIVLENPCRYVTLSKVRHSIIMTHEVSFAWRITASAIGVAFDSPLESDIVQRVNSTWILLILCCINGVSTHFRHMCDQRR